MEQWVEGQRFEDGALAPVREALAVEAILQIRINGTPYTTTVRTPGADEALARGLLFSEEVLTDLDVPCRFESILDPETGIIGAMDVRVAPERLARAIDDRRTMAATASCGLCGVRDAADLKLYGGPLRVTGEEAFSLRRVEGMVQAMKSCQRTFESTGGCHAAAAFTIEGEMLAVHEDIGRHNAVDKVIGELITAGSLDRARCLAVSGRMSYEIVFKAFHARLPFLLSVSAPSSLAVEMGEQFGLTIIGFCRDNRATVYSQTGRVTST
nr:formate dehydrogenase chain D [uncultured bacterium]